MRASKGKIMEILDSHAVVMTREGHFNRIERKESMRIGAEVIYTSNDLVKKPASKRVWGFSFKAQVAVAMFVMLALVISQVAMPAAYAVVSLDINPSLELTVDASRKVVSINPINSEADELLESYVLNENKDLHAVINELIKLSSDMGYLTSENHNVILATALIDRKNSGPGSNELMKEILDEIEKTEYTFDFTLVSTIRNTEELKSAKSEGLSLGQYVMAKENFIPPGQEKKLEQTMEVEPLETEPASMEPASIEVEPIVEDEEKTALPPGQAVKEEKTTSPPGQADSKEQVAEKSKNDPPGQEMKEKNAPPKFVITEKKATQSNDKGKGNGSENNNSGGSDKGNNKGGGKGN
jgi:hypothetical protein